MSNAEPFYRPEPGTFGHNDAWRLFTTFAAELERAELAVHFPTDSTVRDVAIELLAERCTVSDVAEHPRLIADAIVEAIETRYAHRGGSPIGGPA
jgi:hypothetical protein